jgi:hypothetical protein
MLGSSLLLSCDLWSLIIPLETILFGGKMVVFRTAGLSSSQRYIKMILSSGVD